MKSTQRLIALSLALGLGCGAAFAQIRKPGQPLPPEPGDQGSEQFMDTVNVSVINVDVYVTDKKGNPVAGLTKDDFELFENKRPVEITNFYAVSDGKAVSQPEPPPVAAAAGETAPVPPPAAFAEPARTPEDQRLRMIVYIDNFNLRPFNRNRVIRELRAFLGQNLGRDDQVMLATYDRELHIRRTFTSDPGIIASALTELEKISAQGVHADSERRDTLERIEESRSVIEAENYARTYAESTYNDLAFSIDGLKKLTDSLAGMPGRKAIVYVSDGLQMIAGQDVFYAVQNKYGEQSTSVTKTLQFDVSRRLSELAAQANANRTTFYTIDAAGLRVYESTSAETRGHATAPGLTQIVDSVRFSNLQSTLQLMAEKTGGVAVINTNTFMPALERIARDFKSYYSLGYTPPHFGDGRYY
ncbi:MAG TPA: VWA domain-containing protein, partial [Thermoanaerobaculia bacterium]|nr:VWA domain-containing protein [Thermoanaerobaculia bacterium]